MILIISNFFEITSTKVLKWLMYFNEDVVLLNEKNNIVGFEMVHGKDFKLKTAMGQIIDMNNLKSVWYRRGSFSYEFNESNDIFSNFIKNEWIALDNYIMKFLYKRYNTSNPDNLSVNKLLILDLAKSLGLQVPETIICDNGLFVHKKLKKT
ncbi:MAG: hypothetical protein GX259_07140 [Bacteroidales bacterium]|nr:hypothetical protein [Bacteroidales bacterium]